MATSLTTATTNTYVSSGIYYKEVDLTVIQQAVGGFSAAAICLTEKGPAFEITNSATYTDRAFRLGDLNPLFPSSYFAKQYLQQAQNYKEVRLLGLEGYKDTQGYAITYQVTGSSPAVPGTSALTAGTNSIACILKARNTAVTGRAAITSVSVANTTYIDPSTQLSVTNATDYLFALNITYSDSTSDTVVVSLRPSSNDYILTKFGQDPLNPPTINNKNATLWIDYVIPSNTQRFSMAGTLGYYLPGSSVSQSTLPLTTGNCLFGTNIVLQSAPITNVVTTSTSTTVTVGSDITSWLQNGGLVEIQNIDGTGNITQVNGNWKAASVAFLSPNTTFVLQNITTGSNLIISGATTFSNDKSPVVYNLAQATWETNVLDLYGQSGITYQTPITPWFVSDGDNNGDYKRLFRFWSISDGKSANTEVKVEIRNINSAGNNQNGQFDIVVRTFSDREDLTQNILESFTNLNMDPSSDNYIQKRIGDGENYALRSKFIFVEMNSEEDIPINYIPFGVLGYPNVTGAKFPDVNWTLEYNQSQSIAKQSLGLANNSINMFQQVPTDILAFKNATGAVLGKGFHLNPNQNATFATVNANVFSFQSSNNYNDSNGIPLTLQNKVPRNKFVVDFYGGFDGWNVYSQRTWSNTNSADYQSLQLAIAQLSDNESLDADFTVLTTPDIYFDTNATACQAVLSMVQTRGDCLYIADLSYDQLADVNNAASLVNASNMLSNEVCVYFPWLQIEDVLNQKNVWVAPSILALGTIAYTATNQNVWQPPGGPIRTVTNNLVRSRRRLKLGDREVLKTANINPITLFPGSGYEITEVRTTQPYFSALSFIHNRLLLCYAKKVLNQVLRPLLLQLNSQIVDTAFINTVKPIFDRIKKLNGIQDYTVSVLPTDPSLAQDRVTLAGQIVIIPLYPVEQINVSFVLQDSGLTFNQ